MRDPLWNPGPAAGGPGAQLAGGNPPPAGLEVALQTATAAQAPSALDDLTFLACTLCQTPVAFVCSLSRQGWHLSHNAGYGAEPVAFDVSFYTFAVTQAHGFEIRDLRVDPLFAGNRLVNEFPHFRFFAGVPVVAEDGKVLGAVCVLDSKLRTVSTHQRQGLEALARQARAQLLLEDLQEGKAGTRELVENERRREQRSFECASIGMARLGAEGGWLAANGALCALLGCSMRELLDSAPGALVHPEDRPAATALVEKLLAGEIPSCSGELRLVHKSGRTLWAFVHAALARDPHGEPVHFQLQAFDITELKSAEAGRQDAATRLQAFLELPVPAAVLMTDPAGVILSANRQFEQISGYGAAELAGRKTLAFLHVEAELKGHCGRLKQMFGSEPEAGQALFEHARRAGPEAREWSWLRKDGSVAGVVMHVAALRAGAGIITGFAISATPKAAASNEPAETTASSFASIAASAPLGLFLADADGNCAYANRAFEQITGVPMSAAAGAGWHAAFDASERAGFLEDFQAAVRRGVDFRRETRLAREDGPRWARVCGREIFFKDSTQGYVGTVEDVTDLVLETRRLKSAEERARQALLNSPAPMVMLDGGFRFAGASTGWLDLHQLAWHQVNNRSFFELFPSAQPLLGELFQQVMRGAVRSTGEEMWRPRPEAAMEWVRWHLAPWRVCGVTEGVLLVEERGTVNHELRQRAEEARQAAEDEAKSKTDFMTEITAELRTPGIGIAGLAELLLEGETDAKRREYLELIRTSTSAWLKLVAALHDFSKLEVRKQELNAVPFNLTEGIYATIRSLCAQAGASQVELLCLVKPEVPSVLVGDGVLLFQILSHLTQHAIQSSPHGQVVVSAELAEGEEFEANPGKSVGIQLSIHDSGGRMPEAKMAEIQQALALPENAPLPKAPALLGLIIASRWVSLMSGRLWLERTESGTIFHFTAPLAGRPAAVEEAPATFHGVPVLVADGNPTHRRWLHELLTGWRMKVTVLENPATMPDVLEIAQEAGRPYRLTLLDTAIPGRDMFGLAAQVRANPRTASTQPVLLISAGTAGGGEQQARQLGLESILIKPFPATELKAVFTRLLEVPGLASAPGPGRVKSVFGQRPRLNILVVDDSRRNQEVALSVLGREGHRVTIARNDQEAAAIIERRPCDMILVGLDTPGGQPVEMLAAIRQREQAGDKPVRIIGLTADRRYTENQPGMKDIPEAFLPNPIQPGDLALLVEQLRSEPIDIG